jgi:hypothetical protein
VRDQTLARDFVPETARARRDFEWKEPFGKVMDYNFHRSKGKIFCRWFEGGVTNVRTWLTAAVHLMQCVDLLHRSPRSSYLLPCTDLLQRHRSPPGDKEG